MLSCPCRVADVQQGVPCPSPSPAQPEHPPSSEAGRPPCTRRRPCRPSLGAHVAAAGEVVDHPGDDVVHPGQDLLPGVQGHLPVAQQVRAADPPPVPVRVWLLWTGSWSVPHSGASPPPGTPSSRAPPVEAAASPGRPGPLRVSRASALPREEPRTSKTQGPRADRQGKCPGEEAGVRASPRSPTVRPHLGSGSHVWGPSSQGHKGQATARTETV